MHPPRSGVPGTFFLDDDTPLLVYLCRVACDEMGVVMYYEQACVHYARACNRYVVEHICGLFHSGGGVDVTPEFRPDALEVVQYLLVREISGAVEAHVLEEMCEPVLVRSLLYGPDIGGQIEFRSALGLVVVPYVIGESIVQLSLADSGIVRKLLYLRSLTEGHRNSRQQH